jgi:two-component system sensor kinase FixL
MSWVTVIFSMIGSACLTMALIYGFIWARKREVWVNLFFAMMSLGAGVNAGFELAQMRADSPAQIALALRWEHVSVWVALLGLA